MWELDCEESWALKNWCFWTVVLEKTLESPLDFKEIQPVHSEGDQPWDFFGGNDAEIETPVLWPPDAKSWLIGKDPDAGRDWGQEEKGTTEDEMVGWHHWLDGHEFGWTLGVGDGQGGLACWDSWGCKESDTTERLNWTELNWTEQEKVNTSLKGHNASSYHNRKRQWVKNKLLKMWSGCCFCFSAAKFFNLFDPMNCSTQTSLSFSTSWSLLRLISIESMMPSNHLILFCPIFPALNLSQHLDLSNESALHIRWPKYWSFQHQSFEWIFRVDFL